MCAHLIVYVNWPTFIWLCAYVWVYVNV